jgi:hypothetical protein
VHYRTFLGFAIQNAKIRPPNLMWALSE